MKKLELGEWADGGRASINVPSLIESRALIQANSGGGKSWALRRLLEITHGHIQQLIIDVEGEFASLREKHDLVIVSAQGGDALASVKTARLLAIRLLETQASAVLDLYDLKAADRHTFVRLFIESLMDAPKALRHPTLVALDEAHLFCPEKGQGDSEATDAVIDIASRGRKRGLCLVAAMQRIGKFNKSAAAELKNKLIGGTGLDVDVKRAAFELGLAPKDAMQILRALKPGHFFGFGPAFGQVDPRELAVGDVYTTHPKVGHKQHVAPPKPTDAIKALLPKLADLPREAEEEARTVDELRKEVARLKRELSAKPAAGPTDAERKVAQKQMEELARAAGYASGRHSGFVDGIEHVAKAAAEAMGKVQQSVQDLAADAKQWRTEFDRVVQAAKKEAGTSPTIPRTSAVAKPTELTPISPARALPRAAPTKSHGDGTLSGAARKILNVLSQFQEGCTAGKLTLMTGYKYSGSFQNALSELRTAGLITGSNTETMVITSKGLAHGPFPELPTGRALGEYWLTHPSFGKAARDILRNLLESPRGMTAHELCEATGYSYSGSFQNALSELRTAGVLIGRNTETMRPSEDLF